MFYSFLSRLNRSGLKIACIYKNRDGLYSPVGGSPTKKLDYVDVFKINKYIMENTFKVEKLDAVNREIAEQDF